MRYFLLFLVTIISCSILTKNQKFKNYDHNRFEPRIQSTNCIKEKMPWLDQIIQNGEILLDTEAQEEDDFYSHVFMPKSSSQMINFNKEDLFIVGALQKLMILI